MNRCARCGQQLPLEAERFCVHCGAEITGRPDLFWPLATLGGVVVLLAAGVVAFLLLRHDTVGGTALPQTTTATAGSSDFYYRTSTRRTTTSTSDDTSTETSASSDEHDPRTVVTEFYDAVNGRDYATAWNLGGKNLRPSYQNFVDGYADTLHDDLTVTSVDGTIVQVTLTAHESGGRSRTFEGSYTVEDGEITHGTLHETG
ncbi:MAG TPA: zinc ribbon domain-containing protein [Amycolatopsis sp.]|nr:zinc ribbon domain-containing protein [Amycolatopsis sp.]